MAALIQFLSYIIVLVLWLSLSLLFIAVYFFCPNEKDFWDQIYDKCDQKSAKFCFMFRFTFGAYKKEFDLSKTTITIEILSVKGSSPLTLLTIPAKLLEKAVPKDSTVNSSLKIYKFIVYRKDSLLDIGYVEVNHNGNGSINVTDIQMQDTNSNESNIAYVGQGICSLPKQKCALKQRYPSAHREKTTMENVLKPSLTLSSGEFLLFFFLSINIILLICVVIIPCFEDNTKFCDDYTNGLISSMFSGIVSSSIAAIVFFILVLIYRFVIKRFNFSNGGKGLWSIIRIVYVIFVLIIGAVCGGFASYIASSNNKFPINNKEQSFNHEIYWMFGVGVGISLFFLFWMTSSSVIAYFIGFFTQSKEIPNESSLGKDMTMDTNYPTTRSAGRGEDDSQDYYNTLMSGNTKVKSISQYMGVQQGGAPPLPPAAAVKSGPSPKPSKINKSNKASKAKSKVAKIKSTESTGSGYFQELMKGQKKVKSVSQYQGVGG